MGIGLETVGIKWGEQKREGKRAPEAFTSPHYLFIFPRQSAFMWGHG